MRPPTRILRLIAISVSCIAPFAAVDDVKADPPDPVVLAAGDIASCASAGDSATAALLAALPGTVITLGDNVYESGASSEFGNCYDPTWGAHLARTFPAPGNHDYVTAGAAGYYGYFGAAAGDPAKGYYSYDLGTWHIIVINSNCVAIGGCGAGSLQETWLRADLAAHATACTLAYWHHPLFSSGLHGAQAFMRPIFQALYESGADVVLNGHDHDYERFAPQTQWGIGNAMFGIREFVVGTGGRGFYPLSAPAPNSEVRNNDTFGVLMLTLHLSGYDWQFVPEAGKTFADSGSGTCHDAPPVVGGVAEQLAGAPAVGAPDGWGVGLSRPAALALLGIAGAAGCSGWYARRKRRASRAFRE